MNSKPFLWFLITLVVVLILGGLYLAYPKEASPAPEAAATTTAATSEITTATTSLPALDEAAVAQAIVGDWVSIYDSNYTVHVTASGTWTDSYKGNDQSAATESGAYTLFTSTNPDKGFTGTPLPGAVYLKVAEGNSTLYYGILAAGQNELQLNYLDRGDTISFVRVQ